MEYMTPRQHEQMLRCQAALLKAFTAEAKRRDEVGWPTWEVNERRVIQQAAYAWAAKFGLETRPTMADVERVEQLAVGHIDYASKLCLYVAELVYGQREVMR